MLPKQRLRMVKARTHRCMLRTLPGEHERDGPLLAITNPVRDSRCWTGRQRRGSVVEVVANKHSSMVEGSSADLQRIRNVPNIETRMTIQMIGQVARHLSKGRFGSC